MPAFPPIAHLHVARWLTTIENVHRLCDVAESSVDWLIAAQNNFEAWADVLPDIEDEWHDLIADPPGATHGETNEIPSYFPPLFHAVAAVQRPQPRPVRFAGRRFATAHEATFWILEQYSQHAFAKSGRLHGSPGTTLDELRLEPADDFSLRAALAVERASMIASARPSAAPKHVRASVASRRGKARRPRAPAKDLDSVARKILNVLLGSATPIGVHALATHCDIGCSAGTMSGRLKSLIARGLVVRPGKGRSGVMITSRGRALMRKQVAAG